MKKLIGLFLLTAIISCNVKNNSMSVTDKILSGKWVLTHLNEEEVFQAPPLFVEFMDDQKISGYSGCNRLMGEYALNAKGNLTFDKLANTRMACAPDQMKLESKFVNVLESASMASVKEGVLELKNADKEVVAKFKKTGDDEIVNKYWKLIKLDGKDVSMAENQDKEQYFMLRSDGTFSGYAGCNLFNGEYELNEGMRLRFKDNMAVTRKSCPDVEINEQEFLEVFKLTDNYTMTDGKLYLNIGRRAPLAVFEAVYF